MDLEAAAKWSLELAGWAIPDEIIDRAPESPWGFPAGLFAGRTGAALKRRPSPAHRRSLEVLPEGGTVLDVGVGGGAGSLPLASRASLITGVDPSQSMLDSFRTTAAEAGVRTAGILGNWPEVAPRAPQADVVVCHHVFYNVPDLVPFAAALTSKARRRVVVELTPTHPLAWMSDLWMRFHNLQRPSGPTYADALEVLEQMRLGPQHEVNDGPPVMGGFPSREDAVALVRKRLCLHPARDHELVEALGDRLFEREGMWSASPPTHRIATIWWDR